MHFTVNINIHIINFILLDRKNEIILDVTKFIFLFKFFFNKYEFYT